MKQNERLLVYAVTCFLAVILVFAVLFGNDSKAAAKADAGANNRAVLDLGKILDEGSGRQDATAAGSGSDAGGRAADSGASQTSGESPLHTRSPAIAAAELVTQQLGVSRRDQSVRYVLPRAGDTLESLVQRWCGSRDFLEKARRLNEDLRVVQLGKEVGLPWVDDAVLLELHAIRQVDRLAPAGPGSGGSPTGATSLPAATPGPGSLSRFDELVRQIPQQPVVARRDVPATVDGATVSNPVRPAVTGDQTDTDAKKELAASIRYEVKAGDSWWRIADRTYGRSNADKMVKEMQRANPGAGAVLKVGQILLLPPKS